MLMNILHKVPNDETVKGNIKTSWQNLALSDDNRVEFEELIQFHNQFPRLFGPAFRIQIQLHLFVMGNRWWNNKKNELFKIKEKASKLKLNDKNSIEAKEKRIQMKKTRKKMGLLQYYICPCLRVYYQPPIVPLIDPALEEAKRKRAEAIAAAKRAYELKLKNPETQAWKQYQIIHPSIEEDSKEENSTEITKTDADQLIVFEEKPKPQVQEKFKTGDVKVLKEMETIKKKRNERAEKRQDRRDKRKSNPDLQ